MQRSRLSVALISGKSLKIRNLSRTIFLAPWIPISIGSSHNNTVTTKTCSKNMINNNTHTTTTTGNDNNPPNVVRMQQLLQNNSTGGWEKCWEEGITPWDLGKPTPILVQLHQTGSLPEGWALIPGCGSGYDVITIACTERHVVGLDISDKALEKAKELSAPLQNADHCTFLKEDFFTWQPSELFDLIFDYTFFCAIKPDLRSSWAVRMRDLLKPDGELITLMFPISDHVGGPPYKACVSDYEEVLHPVGFEAILIEDNELAIGARKGREKLGRWKKITGQSLL